MRSKIYNVAADNRKLRSDYTDVMGRWDVQHETVKTLQAITIEYGRNIAARREASGITSRS